MGSSQSQSSNKIDDSSSNTSDSEDSDDYQSIASDMEKPENLSQLTSDAAFTSRYIFHKPSMDEIGVLDNNLDINDKISLIYLLYDHPNKACEMLERSFDGVVKEWFKLEGQFIQEWHLKVLEALCIIKHFKGLKILGHNKADMTSTFLPFNKLVSVKVNKIRKALYCIFEDLQPNEVDQLFKILQQDILKKYISTILDKNNLELTFLHLEMSGYISLINLTNLIFLFKQMGLLSVWEDFKMLQENICFSTHDQIGPPVGATSINWGQSANSSFMNDDVTQRNIDHYDNQYLQNVGEVQEKSTIQQSRNREICDIEDSYHVDPLKPGLLLIIDNENFYTENRQQFKHLLPNLSRKLEDRSGTKTDRESLQKVFTNLNFNVVVKDNLRHDQIKEDIKDCIKTVEKENYSSLFIAILSHGDKGVIYGCNTIPVDIAEIQKTLYAKSLSGKPKILIIQACQGENRQRIDDEYTTDGVDSSTLKLTSPKTADVLAFYATIPDYTAIRHLKNGTWFIQSLCEKMASTKDSHFEEICLEVKRDVVKKRWGTVVMVPLVESSLTKKLYLPGNVTKKISFNFESRC